MKKILAMLLCLTMLLCAIPFSATAAEEETTTTGEIKTLAELQAITGDGDYYLANDIYVDLSTVTLPLIASGFKGNLDGKGHSILFENADGTKVNATSGAATNEASLSTSGGIVFATCAAKSVKNLTVGSAETPAKLTFTRSGGTNGGVFAQIFAESGVRPVFENITVYGNIYHSKAQPLNAGILFGEGNNNAYIINCKVVGEIQANSGASNLGGLLGVWRPQSTNSLTVHLINCVADVTFSAYNNVTVNASTAMGGLVGSLKLKNADVAAGNITAYNCLVLNTPTASCKVGAFCANVEVGTLTTTNCATLDTLADGLALTTDRVASIRFAEPTGIRYRTSVSGLYDTLVGVLGAENVKLGTLIAPELYVTDAGTFTKEALDALTDIDSERYVEVAYSAEEWYETTTESIYTNFQIDANTAYAYTGAIAEILPANYAVNYCGIGYLSYSADGGNTWTTIYADYAEVEGQTGIPAYSIQYLAQCAVEDTNAGYTSAQLEALQKYLPATAE